MKPLFNTRVRPRRTILALFGSLVLAASLLTAPAATADHIEPQVVASGLDNPRLLSIDAEGNILVAEAGRGGDGPCLEGPEGDTVCFGDSGAITQVTAEGAQTRVLTGLPSLGIEGTGEQAIGVHDVLATGADEVVFTVGLGGDPELRTQVPELSEMAALRQATFDAAESTLIADLGDFEAAVDPDGIPDSNPVGFIQQGEGYVVADAGGNTVLEVTTEGEVSTLAVLEDQLAFAPPFLGLPPGAQIPAQAVPTSVVEGPDGALYVSQLTGFPFEKGLANIYRIDEGDVSVYATGLTNVTDLAFADNGVLYAVQLATDGLLTGPIGSLVAIPVGGGPMHTVVAGGLFAPYGVAIAGDTAYVTVGSVAPEAGQVLAIHLPDVLIQRAAGSNRYATAALLSATFDPAEVDTVFIASGESYADALAGGPAAATQGAPLLLVRPTGTTVPVATAAELTRLEPTRIVVLGGTAAVSDGVLAALEEFVPAAGSVERVSGTNRYATAAEIAQEFFPGVVNAVFIASGENFPDALAAGAPGARDGFPILLTRPGSLPEATTAELNRLGQEEILLLGGTAAVGELVEADLVALDQGTVARFSGTNRYLTAVDVTGEFYDPVDLVYLASGEQFPDALAAAPVAGPAGAPILLVRPTTAPPAAVLAELDRLGPTEIRILGGTAAVSQAVEDLIRDHLTPQP